MSAIDTFVEDCQRIIIARKERELTDWKDSSLKVALQSIVESEEPGDELPPPPPYIDYWV